MLFVAATSIISLLCALVVKAGECEGSDSRTSDKGFAAIRFAQGEWKDGKQAIRIKDGVSLDLGFVSLALTWR
jgi:hypothetical protein